jgi:hypothetical protein
MRYQIGAPRLVHGTVVNVEVVSQGSKACNTVVQFFTVEIDANLGDFEFDLFTTPSAAPQSGFPSMLTALESSEHEP